MVDFSPLAGKSFAGSDVISIKNRGGQQELIYRTLPFDVIEFLCDLLPAYLG